MDRQFPTNDCNICYLSPEADQGRGARTVHTLPLTRLVELAGEAGDFTARLETSPRFIDTNLCNACGACLAACPEQAVLFTPGLDTNSPTCLRYPQATPEAFSIDMAKCTKCGECVKVCQPEAIDLEQEGSERELKVGSVILASGAESWDPTPMEEWYGYGRFADVVTNLEFERLMSAAGPTGGAFTRPSDGRPIKRIGWIQCAGSRTQKQGGNPYCSSICCMISMKEAIWALEHFDEDLDATIFYMDIRPMGKDYELYYQRTREELGVNFVRCRPHTVYYDQDKKDLKLSFVSQDGQPADTNLDLIVLATGFCPAADAQEQAAVLGIDLDEHRFVSSTDFRPVRTSRPGVYACGMALGPQDIPGSLVQASAASCLAGGDLIPPRSLERVQERVEEKKVEGLEARVGVFLVDWGHVVQRVVDKDALVEAASALPDVVHVAALEMSYGESGLEALEQAIAEHDLNRVVVAGYSPRTHGRIFGDAMQRAGLNRALLEMANIRDQDAMVHSADPAAATAKAIDLVRAAVAGVREAKPITPVIMSFNPDALVVGGGVAGMSAALGLAQQGSKVYLVESSAKLGGMAGSLARTLDGEGRGSGPGRVDHPGKRKPLGGGVDRHHGGGPRGPGGQLHHRRAERARPVLPPGQPRGHHHRHRRLALYTHRVLLRSKPQGHDPAGVGAAPGQGRRQRRAPGHGGYDPVRGQPQPGEPQLRAHLLPHRGEERPVDQGAQARRAGLRALQGHAHALQVRGGLSEGARRGHPVRELQPGPAAHGEEPGRRPGGGV